MSTRPTLANREPTGSIRRWAMAFSAGRGAAKELQIPQEKPQWLSDWRLVCAQLLSVWIPPGWGARTPCCGLMMPKKTRRPRLSQNQMLSPWKTVSYESSSQQSSAHWGHRCNGRPCLKHEGSSVKHLSRCVVDKQSRRTGWVWPPHTHTAFALHLYTKHPPLSRTFSDYGDSQLQFLLNLFIPSGPQDHFLEWVRDQDTG